MVHNHFVQVLRSAQDDNVALRCHPERSEGPVHEDTNNDLLNLMTLAHTPTFCRFLPYFTVIVALAVLPFFVLTVMTAVPAFFAVTTPLPVTVATFLLLLVQVRVV